MRLTSKPSTVVMADGVKWEFRISHLAFLECEETFKKSLLSLYQQIMGETEIAKENPINAQLKSIYELAYCASANYRERLGLDISFRSFVSFLPEDLQPLTTAIGQMMSQAVGAATDSDAQVTTGNEPKSPEPDPAG